MAIVYTSHDDPDDSDEPDSSTDRHCAYVTHSASSRSREKTNINYGKLQLVAEF